MTARCTRALDCSNQGTPSIRVISLYPISSHDPGKMKDSTNQRRAKESH